MAILTAIQSMLSKLEEIQVKSLDDVDIPAHVRIWNDQIQKKIEGQSQLYPIPALFLETIPDQFMPIGELVNAGDINFRIHIDSTHYNTEGTMDQNLLVFAIRDKVMRKLNGFKPDSCGPLVYHTESPDYDHGANYHYTMDFRCHFVDLTGSMHDEIAGLYIIRRLSNPQLIIEETLYYGIWPETGGGNIYVIGGSITPMPGTGIHQWHTGTGTPNISVGYNGDYYRDAVNGDVYYKEIGLWSVVGTLVGGGGGGGGISTVVVSVSSNYTALAAANTNYMIFVTGAAVITLPTAIGNKNRYTIKKLTAGNVSVAFTGGQTADGSSTIQLVKQYEALEFLSDGTNYGIL